MTQTLADAPPRLNRNRLNRKRHDLPSLVLFVDRRLLDPLTVVENLPVGSAIMFRPYAVDHPDILGPMVAALARRRCLRVVVAGDPKLADVLKADGLHLPEGIARHDVLAPALAWRQRTGGWLTMACHSPMALNHARHLKMDAVFISPVFPTESHPGAPALGPLRLAQWSRQCGIPVFALGGITVASRRRLIGCGVQGVAAIDGFT